MLKKILLILLVLLVIAQFIQPPHNTGNVDAPTDITHVVEVPDSILSMLKTACYDCHSNNTNYPWYSKITPVNWWLRNHVVDGKKKLNFTTYANYNFRQKEHKLEEVAETVESHEMPLESYLWIHNEAKLTDAQRKAIIDWTRLARAQVMRDSLGSKK